eukprot:2001732-Amphidinium_carterae.2
MGHEFSQRNLTTILQDGTGCSCTWLTRALACSMTHHDPCTRVCIEDFVKAGSSSDTKSSNMFICAHILHPPPGAKNV